MTRQNNLSAILQSSYIPYERSTKRYGTYYTKVKCIVCHDIIYSTHRQQTSFCRIAHIRCVKKYWDRTK